MNKLLDKEAFKEQVKENVKTLYRKTMKEATKQQIFQAVAYAVKDTIIDNWLATQQQFDQDDPKMVYYMSMEFLMGRALGNNLINLCAYKQVKEALDEMGFDLNVIEDQERMRLWATADWDVWLPASWILLRLWDIPLTAAASVTATVCSSRKLKTATRWRCRITG